MCGRQICCQKPIKCFSKTKMFAFSMHLFIFISLVTGLFTTQNHTLCMVLFIRFIRFYQSHKLGAEDFSFTEMCAPKPFNILALSMKAFNIQQMTYNQIHMHYISFKNKISHAEQLINGTQSKMALMNSLIIELHMI